MILNKRKIKKNIKKNLFYNKKIYLDRYLNQKRYITDNPSKFNLVVNVRKMEYILSLEDCNDMIHRFKIIEISDQNINNKIIPRLQYVYGKHETVGYTWGENIYYVKNT